MEIRSEDCMITYRGIIYSLAEILHKIFYMADRQDRDYDALIAHIESVEQRIGNI
jgi:hypothetical protein